MGVRGGDASTSAERAFTLVELMIAASILGILAAIAVPLYQSALRSARIQKAKQELRVIAQSIDTHRMKNDSVLPLSLADVGHGGRLDPWGNPYSYLNFAAGTGDGMDWAIDEGLVDPAALKEQRTLPPQASDVARSRAKFMIEFTDPAELDSVKRRDKFLFPLNSDYDLFSLGPNGRTLAALGEEFSLDDVIRANDGGYFGVAAEY